MKNTTKTFVIGLALILAAFVFLRNRPEINKTPKTENTSQNTDTTSVSYVPKGTFRNIETGEVFDYIDAWGWLVNCGLEKCKNVIFDVNDDNSIIQIRNSDENPIIGKIISASVEGEKADYYIEYKAGVDIYRSHYKEDLCSYHKGGGKDCHSPSKEGKPVVVITKDGDDSAIHTVMFFNKMMKTQVMSVVNVEHK